MASSPRRPVSPAFSSPSVYSRAHTNIGHGSPSNSSILSHYPTNPIATRTRLATRLQHMAILSDGDESEEDVGISHGPKITKYSDLPLEDAPPISDYSSPGSSVASFARNVTRKATKRFEGAVSGGTGSGLGLDFSIGGGGSRLNMPSEASLVSTTTRSSKAATLHANSAIQGAKSFLSSLSGNSLASSQSTASTGDDNSLIITPRNLVGEGSSYKPPSIASTPTPTPYKSAISPTVATGALTSTPTPLTRKSPTVVDPAKLEPSLFSLSPNPSTESWKATDRPLLSSGSPGFGLISLEVAQERERERAIRKAATATATPKSSGRGILKSRKKSMANVENIVLANDPTHPGSPPKLKGKKSLMKLFKSHGSTPSVSGKPALKIGDPMPMTMIPPVPPLPNGDLATPKSSTWNEDRSSTAIWPKSAGTDALRPKLELRPVSMTFSRGLPTDYLAFNDDSEEYIASASPVARRGSEGGGSSGSPSSTLAVGREWSRPNSVATNATLPDTSSGSAMVLGMEGGGTSKTDMGMRDRASTAASMGSSKSARAAPTTSEDPVEHIQLQIANARKAWRVQISELSSQVRELREELDEARKVQAKAAVNASGGCKRCQCACTVPSPRGGQRRSTITGNTSLRAARQSEQGTLRDVIAGIRKVDQPEEYHEGRTGKGVMDRGRVKSVGARGVFGSGSLYERE